MDTIQLFNKLFPEFMDQFDPGDKPMVKKLIREVFKFPLSDRVYFRMTGGKAVPRSAFNDCNPAQYSIDADLERFVRYGLVEKTEEGYSLYSAKTKGDEG